MILATTDIKKIKPTEIEKMRLLYGDTGKKLEEKIIQSLSARYFCHIICENSIKCTVDDFVHIDDLEEVKKISPILKSYSDGKVSLNDKNLFVSLSHSDSGALAGVSTSKIGADIQKVQTFNEKIAKRYFSQNEIRFINNSKDIDQTFSLVWSFKESLFKSGYVNQKDFWKNSKRDKYSLFDEFSQKDILKFSALENNSDTKVCIFTKICGNFVITGICNKKEAILLVI